MSDTVAQQGLPQRGVPLVEAPFSSCSAPAGSGAFGRRRGRRWDGSASSG
jgi:hypothetical protein